MHRRDIAHRIRGHLKEQGVSIVDIARGVEGGGRSAAAVHHVINGNRAKTVEEAVIWACGFDPWERWMPGDRPSPHGSGGG